MHIVGAVIFALSSAPLAYSAGLKFNSAMIVAMTLLAMCLAQTAYFKMAPYVFDIGILTFLLCLPTILKRKSTPGSNDQGRPEKGAM